MTRVRSILLVTILALIPLSFAGEGEFSPEELDRASNALAERLRGCETQSKCTMQLARIALEERPGGALEKVAYEGLLGSLSHSRKGLTWMFNEGDAEARRRVLELYIDRWNTLGRGFDPNLAEKCIVALEDDDESVRKTAARLIPVPGTAHAAIDAAIVDPSLTRAALHAIATARASFVARWVVEQLSSDDPAVQGTAKRTLYELGRSSAEPLKSAIAGDDAELRARALDALLPIAIPDDVSFLYEWLTEHGESEPELRDRVLRVVAEIESGLYEGEVPPRVPLDDAAEASAGEG